MAKTKCVCCSAKTGRFRNIFKTHCWAKNSEKITLAAVFNKLTEFKLPTSENIANICFGCSSKLTKFYEFRIMCLKSIESLVSVKIKEEAPDIDDPHVETKIEPEIVVCAEEIEPKSEDESEDEVVNQDCEVHEDSGDNQSTPKVNEAESEVETPHQDLDGHQEQQSSEFEEDDEDEYLPPEKVQKIHKKIIKLNNPKGTFVCHFCDAQSETYEKCLEHIATHDSGAAVKIIKRTCNVCNTTPEGCYLLHLKQAHRKYRPNICKECGNGFQSVHMLHKHLLRHTDRKMIQCKGCQEEFTSDYVLRSHIARTKHSTTDYHCPHCGLGCTPFKKLLKHSQASHCQKQYFNPCYACKNVFAGKLAYNRHKCSLNNAAVVDEKHKPRPVERAEVSTSGPYQCHQCPASFSNDDELTCHIHSACTGSRIFPCKICSRNFNSRDHLKRHNQTYHETRRYICDQCGFKAATERTLQEHGMVHRNDRNWECSICSLTFKRRNTWNSHKKCHEPKRYECDLCGRLFRAFNSINVHMKNRHIRPDDGFACSICPKSFVLELDRDRHMASHQISTVKCSICHKQYSSAKYLRKHHMVEHENIRYECCVCHKILANKTILHMHLFLHRGFKPHACNVCDKSFSIRSRLKKHLKGQHNVAFNEKIHGYQETNENIVKIVNGCAIRDGARLSEQQISDLMEMWPENPPDRRLDVNAMAYQN